MHFKVPPAVTGNFNGWVRLVSEAVYVYRRPVLMSLGDHQRQGTPMPMRKHPDKPNLYELHRVFPALSEIVSITRSQVC